MPSKNQKLVFAMSKLNETCSCQLALERSEQAILRSVQTLLQNSVVQGHNNENIDITNNKHKNNIFTNANNIDQL